MPFFVISIIIQIALVVHIVKTGRNTMWIWIVVMLPLAGSIAYLIVEVIPDLMGGRTARKVRKNIESLVNPNKGINVAARDFSISDTIDNSMRLAEECLNKHMYEEAKQLYAKSLRGIHEHDPDIMYGLAKAEFGLKNYGGVKCLLDELIEKNPNYKNADAHLLYARAAEELGEIDLALKEYEVLDSYYPGPEATYRYAILLKNNGRLDKSRAMLEKILHLSKVSGKHYNSLHKEWVTLAKNECSN